MSELRMLGLSVFVMGASLWAGCGGSSGGGSTGGGEVTSVPATKALNALTAAETAQLCKDSGAYAGQVVSKANACKITGLFGAAFASPTTDAQARAACLQIYTPCLSAAGTTNLTCDPIPASCTGTVAQYSACLKDSVVGINQTIAAVPSCNSLTLADLAATGTPGGTDGGTEATPASCATFQAACPGYQVPAPML